MLTVFQAADPKHELSYIPNYKFIEESGVQLNANRWLAGAHGTARKVTGHG